MRQNPYDFTFITDFAINTKALMKKSNAKIPQRECADGERRAG